MDTKTAGRAPKNEASLTRTVDLMVFEVGVGAYRQWLQDNGQDPSEDAHAQLAEAHMVRYREPLQDMFERHLKQFTELPSGSLLNRTFRQASRPGNIKMMFEYRLGFYHRFSRWGMAHREDLNDVFKNRSRRVMREVLQVSDEANPALTVNKLASLQTLSGLNQTRKWLKRAAVLCGEEVDATTEAIADTESAKTVAEELREVKREIEVADPVSGKAADLVFEEEDIKEVLDETIESARDPEAARTNAVDVISDGDLPKWVNEYGLNDEQKRVLLAKGDLLINAGAGSGKTHTMVAKIAYCVRELGYHPDQILATSFTRAASGEIKERVKDRFNIESQNIGRTTHSIAGTLIKRFLPEIEKKRQNLFKGNANTKIGTCMKMAYKQLELQSWMTKGDKYYKRAIGADEPSLSWVNGGVLPSDALGRPIPQKTLEIIIGKLRAAGMTLEQARQEHPNTETMSGAAVAMWASYEYLKENNRQFGPIIDFDDMLKHGHAVLRDNPQARAQMQKQFKVVLVDEAQDQNIVQNEIFDMIGGKADILAYIGDDRQSIYAFRGASPQEFVSRKEKGFEVLTMTNNYRSGSNIVNAGEKLIEYNGTRQLPKTCRAVLQNGEGNIRNRTAESHEAAAASAVREISAAVKAGESPDNFGVVVRNNAEKDAFMIALISQGIPYRSASGSNFFKKPQVKCIVNWLRVAVLDDGVELDNALLTAHEAPGFMLDRKFRSSVERVRGSRLDFIMEGGRDEVYTGRSSWRNQSVVAYGNAVREIREAAQSASGVGDLIQRIMTIQGGVPVEKGGSEMKDVLYWMTEKVNIQELIADSEVDPDNISLEILRDEAKAPLSPLLAMAAKIPDPKRYLALISKLEGAMDRNNAKSKSPENATEEHVPSVQIDTCHQWKGLEAENVYVMMAAGVWPNYRSDQAYAGGDEEAFDEERRLAYVAITRGKQNVTILSPDVNYMGKDAGTSRFVSEACIPEEGVQNKEASVRTADVDVDVYEPGEVYTQEDFIDEFDMDMEQEISLNPLGDLIYEAFIQGDLK